MSNKLKIVADENMPHIDSLFGDYAEISFRPGRQISAQDVRHADALLCRSITDINARLLQSSTVKFVGSATIGTDHLDTEWMDNNQICWTNAAGCNADAVAQYVMSAIAHWLINENRRLEDICVGIVGAGNVGTSLSRCLGWFGVKYLLCDPLLECLGDPRSFVSFDEVSGCDVVTFHVPMSHKGNYPTYHLVDKNWLGTLTDKQLVINASRGAVIDNCALSDYLKRGNSAQFVLDVFENEPEIDQVLVEGCLLATPHIAGHTIEGKSRGSWMIYQRFCEYFDLPCTVTLDELLPAKNEVLLAAGRTLDNILLVYDIVKDSSHLKHFVSNKTSQEKHLGHFFDSLRRNYVQEFGLQSNGLPRRDYSGWILRTSDSCHTSEAKLLLDSSRAWQVGAV
ncbi:4-phosphoerythronate dehydrogenase [Aliikangiella sp. G2MR2-5]|uniref:4-phosphoerythronate dehydrogenase n=1 Tax=Aliikangiella sp. G2MR2-5 TaxID=2788943 RepID=UPI0018AB4618|nr:4-phosphoerythronate dehydrogenase [Aliikangiella sp. G2MR2-5]